jgi:hypothetical protein
VVAKKENKSKKRPKKDSALGYIIGAATIGLVYGGSKLVKIWDWDTDWHINAPLDEVYKALTTPELQYKWWPSMVVTKAEQLEGYPNGRKISYEVKQASSVARFAPPFRLNTVLAEPEKDTRIRTVVSGDLIGILETLFYSLPEGGTKVRYHWYVRCSNPLFNLAGWFFTPVFRASHDHVMKEGEAGLNAYLQNQ